jgi:WhiB family transcriptional regulator, redox-sensing transcriptional regulator
MERAKCATVNPDVFFGKEYEGAQRHRPSLTSIAIRRAKAICAVCPVLWDCFNYAMDNDEEYGVWGGTTRRERQRLRNQSQVDTRLRSSSLS